MDKSQLINKLNMFNNSECSVGLQLINKNGMNYCFLQSSIDDDTQSEIFKILMESTLDIVKKNELAEFNSVGKEDLTIEKINVSDVEGLKKIIDMRKDNNNFTQNIKELGDINAYLLEVRNGQENLKIFRRYSKSKSLSKGVLLQVVTKQFTKLNENIFQIDNIIDFIAINDEVAIVFNRYPFELITNYKDNYFVNINRALIEISESNLINNMEQFAEDCKESTKIAKQFTKAMQDNSINLILANIDEVALAISEVGLPIDFIDNKFQYESKEQLSILVALLSDKYAKTLIGKRITNSQ